MYFVCIALVLAAAAGTSLAGYQPLYHTAAPQYTPYYPLSTYQAEQTYHTQPIYQKTLYHHAPAVYNYVPHHGVQQHVVSHALHETAPQTLHVAAPYTVPQHTAGYTTPVVYVDQQTTTVQEQSHATPSATEEGSAHYETKPELDNFRGFAYHTEYSNGAHSNVLFITGPEIHNLNKHLKSEKTPASDSVDTIATEAADAQSPSFRTLMKFLNNPQIGVQKFYAVNDGLVVRNLEDPIPEQYPANVHPAGQGPASQPISPIIPLLRASFSLENIEKLEKTTHEPEVAASETNTKSIAPETTSQEVGSFTTVAVAATTAATTTEVAASSSTTTEASSSTTTEAAASSSTTMQPIVVEDASEKQA